MQSEEARRIRTDIEMLRGCMMSPGSTAWKTADGIVRRMGALPERTRADMVEFYLGGN